LKKKIFLKLFGELSAIYKPKIGRVRGRGYIGRGGMEGYVSRGTKC
jgi:hypothetical protein